MWRATSGFHGGGRKPVESGRDGVGFLTSCDVLDTAPDYSFNNGIRITADQTARGSGPPLRDHQPYLESSYRDSIVGKWSRLDAASSLRISTDWRHKLPPKLTKCASDCMQGVKVDFNVTNFWVIAQPGDIVGRLSSEVRISARHIHDLNLSKRKVVGAEPRYISHIDPHLVGQVTDYRTRGVIPVYRGATPPIPGLEGWPSKKRHSLDVISKLRKGVENGRISFRIMYTIGDFDYIVCTHSNL